MIEKKTIFKSLIIISLLIIIIFAFIQIRNTLARYETTASTDRNVDVAFWLVDTNFALDRTTFESKKILIDEIYPSNTPYEYTFSVSNFNQANKIADTDLEYYLVLTATTNLPLNYVIEREGTTIATYSHTDDTEDNRKQLITDENGTKYVQMKLGTAENQFKIDGINDETNEKSKKSDSFVIKVTFPKTYSSNEEYRDLMEYIKLDLSARQVIEEPIS